MKKPLLYASSIILSLSLVVAPYSINPNKLSTNANLKPIKDVIKEKQEIYFISSEVKEGDTILNIENKQNDDSLKNIKKYLKEGLLTVKSKKINGTPNIPNSVTDIVVPITEASTNIQLQNELREKFNDGKKVYFYGNAVNPESVEEILGVKEIGVDYSPNEVGNPANNNDGSLKKGKLLVKSKEDVIKEYGPLKENAPKISEEESEYEVIGYTLNDEPNAIVLAHIHSDDNIVTPAMALQTILSSEIKELEAKNGITFNLAQNNLITPNKVAAGSVQVKSYLYGYSATYSGSTLVGDQDTRWVLYRDISGDADPTVDRFSVEDITTITGYNGFTQYYAKVDHDIPLDRDRIYKWGPGDKDGTSGGISFSVPWGLSISIPVNGHSFDVNDIGYAPLDYARWELTSDFPHVSLPNPTRFESGTAWYSQQSSTFATMDIRHWATLDDFWGTDKQVYGMFDVDYDY